MANTKFTEERREKILTCLREGNYIVTAAGVAGVNRRTLNRWLERGREEQKAGRNTVYTRFVDDTELAEAEGEFLLVNEVRKGGPKGALQILKRRHPNRWGDKLSQELTGKGGGPIATEGKVTLNLTMQTPEDGPWEHGEDTEEVESQA